MILSFHVSKMPCAEWAALKILARLLGTSRGQQCLHSHGNLVPSSLQRFLPRIRWWKAGALSQISKDFVEVCLIKQAVMHMEPELGHEVTEAPTSIHRSHEDQSISCQAALRNLCSMCGYNLRVPELKQLQRTTIKKKQNAQPYLKQIDII